jgi:hypothetical protein
MKITIYTSPSSIGQSKPEMIEKKLQIYQKHHGFTSEKFHQQAQKRWKELKTAITFQSMKRAPVHLDYNYYASRSHSSQLFFQLLVQNH